MLALGLGGVRVGVQHGVEDREPATGPLAVGQDLGLQGVTASTSGVVVRLADIMMSGAQTRSTGSTASRAASPARRPASAVALSSSRTT